MELVEVVIEYGARTMVVRGKIRWADDRVVAVFTYQHITGVDLYLDAVHIERIGGMGGFSLVDLQNAGDVMGEIRARMERA